MSSGTQTATSGATAEKESMPLQGLTLFGAGKPAAPWKGLLQFEDDGGLTAITHGDNLSLGLVDGASEALKRPNVTAVALRHWGGINPKSLVLSHGVELVGMNKGETLAVLSIAQAGCFVQLVGTSGTEYQIVWRSPDTAECNRREPISSVAHALNEEGGVSPLKCGVYLDGCGNVDLFLSETGERVCAKVASPECLRAAGHVVHVLKADANFSPNSFRSPGAVELARSDRFLAIAALLGAPATGTVSMWNNQRLNLSGIGSKDLHCAIGAPQG